jgi:hypothetical protein
MLLKTDSTNELDFERVLTVIDDAIKPAYLNKVQELVLLHTYEGKTYSEIAAAYCYDSEYIKTVGCELWRLLSKSFNQQITKANFSQFVRKYTNRSKQTEMLSKNLAQQYEISYKRRQDWGNCSANR